METRSNHVLVGAIVLIMLAAVAIFTVWLARLGSTDQKTYDIFFKQAVDGLNKGSPVAFSGVPSGQVEDIQLWQPDPQFVKVRITVKGETPILQGTSATIQGIGFTGVSQVALDGAVKGAPAISQIGPAGVPVIPTRTGGLGAILNSAPRLLERLTTLTERLTALLSDRNQASIAGILDNTNRLTDAFADRAPEIAATMAQTRIAIEQAGNAAQEIGQLANTTDTVLAQDVRPAMQNLNKAIGSAQKSAETLDAAINDARPGLQAFSKQTVPELGALIRDLRQTSEALSDVTQRVDQGGVGSIAGSPKLPDYEP